MALDSQLRETTAKLEEERENATTHLTIAKKLESTHQGVQLEAELKHREEVQTLREQLTNLHSVVEQNKNDLQMAQQRSMMLLAAKDDLLSKYQSSIDSLEAEKKKSVEEIKELKEKESSLDDQVSALHEKVFSMREEQRLREEALDVLLREAEQKDRFEHYQKSVAALTSELEQCKETMRKTEASHHEALTVKSTQITDLITKLESKEVQLENRQARIIDMEKLLQSRAAPQPPQPIITSPDHTAITIDPHVPSAQLKPFGHTARMLTLNNYVFIAIFLLLVLGFYNSSRC
eukprot:TRINITY_DN26404_c0_g1_i1.p1 TRINITY_DN26404_c0_g1~~TRINITY_DN26404_c0_g1_i1.p1  ORF type:complete len:314 (+),score=65.01 TRINITY_DN26404_c0_g1_i1:67-942(+)